MRKLLICLAFLLTGMLAVSCTGGDTTGATLPADTDTPTEVPTEALTEAPTDASAEETTEEETTEAPFDPLAFEPMDLPVANIAREGFALGSATKNDEGYSNLHLNDGDLSTGFSTPWGKNTDASKEYYFFIDLTSAKVLDSVKVYSLADDEGGFPKAFDILVSADGESYTTAATVNDASAEAAKDGLTVELGGVEARFVKLVTRELGAGDPEKGRYLALSEFEVYSPIDTASNMILNRHDIWLFKNPDTTQQLSILYYRDGTAVDAEAKLKFATLDANVATVDENGLITPVGLGETDVYVTDGKNLAVCHVEVKEEVREEFRISAFYHSNFAYPEQIPVGLKILAEGGVEYIEDTRSVDRAGNHISMYSLFVCNELGLAYSPNDPAGSHDFLEMKDEEILAIVKKYENRAGFYGIYLQDEPHDEYLGYARVFHLIQEYNPHIIPHLNLLPPYNFGGIDEYFTEFAAVAGGNGRMRFLTYDHYPFTWNGGFDSKVYSSLNRLRKAGLLYQADTGYYMQSMIITGGYPLLDANALRYNASLGMAYGMKNYKWFVALTPVDAEKAAFETGFVSPDFTPAGNYEGLIAAGEYIKTVGKVLGNSDAIEVYHGHGEIDNPVLPDDFVFTLAKTGDAIFTLYQSLDGSGQQHVVITNKKFTAKDAMTLTLKANKQGAFKILDLTTGEMKPLAVGADGTFTLDLAPGQCAVIELPADWDVSRPDEKSENLALNKPVYVSSSSASFWQKGNVAAYHLTNGDPTIGYWVADRSDRSGWLKLDLLEVCEINTLKMYMCTGMIGSQRCKDFTVYVSEDGVNYTKVAKVVNHKWDDLTVPLDLTFDTVKARYIRIESDSNRPMGVGEIEVYG
ncbi:MAG: discoidin domain-containing protein [Clostridia bacterium]|nr:discoidin domain-containing protein [Clostridia bacterium]